MRIYLVIILCLFGSIFYAQNNDLLIKQAIEYVCRLDGEYSNNKYQEALKILSRYQGKYNLDNIFSRSLLLTSIVSNDRKLIYELTKIHFSRGYNRKFLKSGIDYLLVMDFIDDNNVVFELANELDSLYVEYFNPSDDQINELREFVGLDQGLRKYVSDRDCWVELNYKNLNRFINWIREYNLQLCCLGRNESDIIMLLRHFSKEQFQNIIDEKLFMRLINNGIVSITEFYWAYAYVFNDERYNLSTDFYLNNSIAIDAKLILEINHNRKQVGLLPLQFDYTTNQAAIDFKKYDLNYKNIFAYLDDVLSL